MVQRVRIKFCGKILLVLLSFSSALHDCYRDSTLCVSAENGSTKESCGSMTNPCQFLHQAVEMSNKSGRVIIQGVQTLTSGINITKNISIVGVDGATVVGNKSSLVAFNVAFPDDNLNWGSLTVYNITFIDISVISIHSKSFIRIIECSIYHTNISSRDLRMETIRGDQIMARFSLNKAVLHLRSGSDGTHLEVRNSTFMGLDQGFVLKTDANIARTTATVVVFDGCLVREHLGIYMMYKYIPPPIELEIKNCEFINIICRAIDISRVRKLSVTNSSFKNSSGCIDNKDSGRAIQASEISSFLISDCEFRGGSGALYITSSVIIKRTLFKQNKVLGNGGDIFIGGRAHIIVLKDCLFAYSKAVEGANGGSVYIKPKRRLTFSNCAFLGNNADKNGGAVMVHQDHPGRRQKPLILFKKCRFYGNKAAEGGGGAIAITIKNAVVNIQSCIFDKNLGNVGGGIMAAMYGKISKTTQMTIYTSIFRNNHAIMVGGGMYATEERKPEKCVRKKSFRFRPVQKAYSVLIRDCKFMNNSATSLGQSIYSNDHTSLQNISVITFEKYIAPHISLDTGDINFQCISVRINRDSRFRLPSKSRGIELKSRDIKLSKGLMLTCPTNFRVDQVKNISEQISLELDYNRYADNSFVSETKYHYLSVECKACPFASYSLESGRLNLEELSTTVPPVNNVAVNFVKCNPCPTGAICDVDVKAVDNFWGFTSSSQLSFILCPHGFCCGKGTNTCSSFNTCAEGRSGDLCGSCAEGYKLNFVKGSCIQKGELCDADFFIVYVIAYVITYTLLFVLVTNAKDIIVLLRRNLFKNNPAIASTEIENTDELSLAGYAQMIILFFQVASLFQVEFQGGQQKDAPGVDEDIRKKISEIFEFRFSIYQKICPSENLTFLQKELILLIMRTSSLVCLMLLILVCFVFKCLRKGDLKKRTPSTTARAPSNEISLEETSRLTLKGTSEKTNHHGRSYLTLSFISMIRCTFIKLLKMFYTPVAKSAFTMIHCLNIRGESRLYVSGDHVCYSAWQWVIIWLMVPSLSMFPFCFELALRLIKQRKISSWKFVVASACPYYAAYLYISKCKQIREEISAPPELPGENEELSFRRTILEGEELLFKEPEGLSLGWQVVQFYRTFVITFISTFIINPMYRQITYVALLLIFMAHDRYRNPYKHSYLNLLQLLTSRCLLVVLTCNFIPAVSYLVNVRTIPFIYDVVKALRGVELMVYAAVPLSLPFWKLKIFIENRYATKKK